MAFSRGLDQPLPALWHQIIYVVIYWINETSPVSRAAGFCITTSQKAWRIIKIQYRTHGTHLGFQKTGSLSSVCSTSSHEDTIAWRSSEGHEKTYFGNDFLVSINTLDFLREKAIASCSSDPRFVQETLTFHLPHLFPTRLEPAGYKTWWQCPKQLVCV